MLPITVASAVTAARESDARTRAARAYYQHTARMQPERPVRAAEPPQPRRRLRWHRRTAVRTA